MHERRSGVASLVVDDEDAALDVVATVLDYLPSNHLDDPPVVAERRPGRPRLRRGAVGACPARANASYDVRVVIDDVLDADSFLELRAGHAPNLVTGLARLDGRPVGVIANQPQHRAGTIDIEASREGGPASCSGATASTCRSSRSSTPPGSSPARTSSGAG